MQYWTPCHQLLSYLRCYVNRFCYYRSTIPNSALVDRQREHLGTDANTMTRHSHQGAQEDSPRIQASVSNQLATPEGLGFGMPGKLREPLVDQRHRLGTGNR